MTGRRNEEGMITVEGVLSLVPFIIVILGIISFINIFAVHNKIQYAMYQMGSELSAYTYFYQALGIRAADLGLKADVDANTEKLDEEISNLETFLTQITAFEETFVGDEPGDVDVFEAVDRGEEIWKTGKEVAETGAELISNPKTLFREIVYLGIEKAEDAAKHYLSGVIARGLMNVYLDESFADYQPMSADEYLKYYGVKDGIGGLDFGKSGLFTDDKRRMIDIVVEYDIEVYIFKLFFKDPTIHVVQRCYMPAWLDGDGVTYSK